MKKFARLVCAVLVLGLLLTSCASDSSKITTLDPQNTIYEKNADGAVITDSGIYYTTFDYGLSNSQGIIKYYDFATKTLLPLCSDPSCDHTSHESCNARFEYPTSTLFLNQKRKRLQTAEISKSKVYAVKLDGSGRNEIGDMELVDVSNTHTNFYGNLMMSDNMLAYSVLKKDGGEALYVLPLYENKTAQKIYETTSSMCGDYQVDAEIYIVGICGDFVIFIEDSMVSAPAGVTEEELGRPYEIRTLKYCRAGMDGPVTISEGYDDISPYGDKYLLGGFAGFAVWDPATNELQTIEMPQEVQQTYEKLNTVGMMFYNEGKYYIYFYDASNTSYPGTIFVLDKNFNITNKLHTPQDIMNLKWNSDTMFAVHYGEAYPLAKSELENQTEIYWDFDNLLE